MVDVLYDYQLAMALASENVQDGGKLAELEYQYTQAVFKKHGITDEEFRLSMAHYARNPKDMLAITEKVSQRITGDSKTTEQADNDNVFEKRDTLVLWENRQGLALTSNSNNHYEIDVPAKSLKECNRLLFGFNTKWIYREGAKFGVCMLYVTFDNDSTATVTETIREFSKSQAISINIPQGRKAIKAKATIYQSAFWQKYPQVLSLSDLALWGIKTTKNEPKEPAKPAEGTDKAPNLPGKEPVNPKLQADTSTAATH